MWADRKGCRDDSGQWSGDIIQNENEEDGWKCVKKVDDLEDSLSEKTMIDENDADTGGNLFRCSRRRKKSI